MTGSMLDVTPAGDLDGPVSPDSTRTVLDVVVGGESGTNSDVVKGMSGFGSIVRVRITSTSGAGRQTKVSAPTPLAGATFPVGHGLVSVPIDSMDASAAYQVVISGAATAANRQTYEAENALTSNAHIFTSPTASDGSYVDRIDDSGDARSDSFVDFFVSVPPAGAYRLRIAYASGSGVTSTQSLSVNRGLSSVVSYPSTGARGTFDSTVQVAVILHKGSNVIRLAKGASGFTGGTSCAELDTITLVPRARADGTGNIVH